MPSATKMPPRIINPYPIFCVDSKSFIYSSYLLSPYIQSSHSLSILLNKNPPPMAIKVPPTIGLFWSFFISASVKVLGVYVSSEQFHSTEDKSSFIIIITSSQSISNILPFSVLTKTLLL